MPPKGLRSKKHQEKDKRERPGSAWGREEKGLKSKKSPQQKGVKGLACRAHGGSSFLGMLKAQVPSSPAALRSSSTVTGTETLGSKRPTTPQPFYAPHCATLSGREPQSS